MYFRDGLRKLAVASPDCRVLAKQEMTFNHLCDTGPGSSGAPVLSADGQRVIGVHVRRSDQGGEAMRADLILSALKLAFGSLRVSEEEEVEGLDLTQHSERAYGMGAGGSMADPGMPGAHAPGTVPVFAKSKQQTV